MTKEKAIEERLKNLERSQLNADFVRILEDISRDVVKANEKLDEQNGRLDRHSNEIVDMKLEVKGFGVKIDNLPCEERLLSCNRTMDVLREIVSAKAVSSQSKSQFRTTLFYAFIGSLITAGVGLLAWVTSLVLSGG